MTIHYVSESRLSPYLNLCASEEDAIALHGECMLVGSALLAAISMFEIALRNRIHQQVAISFGQVNWLTTAPSVVPLQQSETKAIGDAKRQAQKDRYSKLSNHDRRALDGTAFPQGVPIGISHTKLVKKRQEAITVQEGEVVAHTTLFFWKRFFAPEYEPTLWKRSVRRLFPNKTLSRSTVSEHVENLYRARNRLAHHEPMYGPRLHRALQSLEFIGRNLDSIKPDDDTAARQFAAAQLNNLSSQMTAFHSAWVRLTDAGT